MAGRGIHDSVTVSRHKTVINPTPHNSDTRSQWRSQGWEVGWAQGVWGMEVLQWGPGAGGGLGALPPEARYAYTICIAVDKRIFVMCS